MQPEQGNEVYHTPIMVDEVKRYLLTNRSGTYIDATVGGGGYAAAILPDLNADARYIGIDRDPDAVQFCTDRFSHTMDRFSVYRGELAKIDEVLAGAGVGAVDGILMDLGVSSYQIDTAGRGFSYLEDGPLDMRMDGGAAVSAADIVNGYSERELADCLYRFGEERKSRRIARRIVEKRHESPITTTAALAAAVKGAVPPAQHIKTFARVWQALRFAVNDELGQLRMGLERSYPLLKPQGRLVVLSYESLMDRLVKRFLRGDEPTFEKEVEPVPGSGWRFTVLTRKVVRPGEEEIRNNPRARSARLRAGIREM
ncbi:16S rRNA (cytosine(1402)-N(4))-methyltransferase RsmH [bacterium]|nr:16S rRNA (cytosine(1402)-N(4))-methyltransferase RsmH [bacterium]